VGTEKGTVGDYIDDVAEDDVVVLDNAGRPDCTVWGEILTSVAHKRKVGGTVIHGVCRDVRRSVDLSYPIFSRGRFMRTGKDRVQVDGINVPVSLGDVQVRPGDILLGNDDGVVVVPKQREEEILSLARRIAQAEERILLEALEGMRLEDARKKYGYHELQRRRQG
jgi:regulator of RNase E activity RraA